jgi:hypothetical protein
MYLQREEKERMCSAVIRLEVRKEFSPTQPIVLHIQIFVVFP